MLFPIESKVIEKPSELAIKHLRALSYLIFRMGKIFSNCFVGFAILTSRQYVVHVIR
jgi:hypothetical protein